MDPLSISASIAGLLALAGTVTQYLSTIANATDNRERLLMEVCSTTGLLYSLKDLCDHVDVQSSIFISLKALGSPQGPFEQFKKTLELLTEKLAPAHGRAKVKKALTWCFDQSELNDLMDVIQRQKTFYMLALQGNHTLLSQKLALSISGIEADVQMLQDGIRELKLEQISQGRRQHLQHDSDVLAWLSPLTFADRLKSALSHVQPGTGEWLLKHDDFLNWLASPTRSQILWLPGIPGSGKTSLAALIIDHLETHFTPPAFGIAYLFCDYKETAQTSESLKRAILRQLLHRLDDLPVEIGRLYETHAKRSTDPSSSEIDDLLYLTATRFSEIFIVIDALDELSRTDGLSESVLKLCKELGSNAHTLVTSRWTGELRHHILQATSIEISARDQDISTYVKHELLARKRLHLFAQKEPTFEVEVINTILGHCKGMFLVARLHIESLASKPHLRAAKLALKQLPSTLDGVYKNAIDRMKSQTQEDVGLAWRVIAWTVRAKSPLTTQQLQHALAVEPECDCLDEDALIDMDLILSVCAGLVVLDAHSSMIRLVHFTAQEYFEKYAQELIPVADFDIARVCLQYLSLKETAYVSLIDQDLSAKLDSFPLLEYAAEHWGTHVTQCSGRDCELDGSVETFFSDEARVSGAVQIMLLLTQRHEGFSRNVREDVRPLHLAAHFGLLRTLSKLLKTETTDSRDTAGRTPLHWAARKGHWLVAKLLLENGAEVDALDNVNATSLHLACRYGHHDFASMLIDYGSNVNAANNVGGTALIWAAICGSEKTASLLLKHGANVHSTTKQSSTALHKAVNGNHEAVVRLLIQHGADVNALEVDAGWWLGGWSPLHVAVANSNEVIMRVLLEAGALPDIQTSSSIIQTIIALAIRRRTDGPLRLLLQFGADPNRRDLRGQTPAHYAAIYVNLAALSALVPFGSLSAVDDMGETLLHYAIDIHDEKMGGEIVRFLLSTQQIDIEARDRDGWTALMRSKDLGLKKITQLLLDAGAKDWTDVEEQRIEAGHPWR